MQRSELVRSPLTGTDSVTLADSVDVKDIAAIYGSTFGIDVLGEFNGIERLGLYRCNQSGLYFFNPAVTGSEHFYESLQEFAWYYLETKSEYDFAKTFVDQGDSVLEVGCGLGHFASALGAREYVGLELSRKAKEIAAAQGLAVIAERVEEFALRHQNRFNIVCSFQVLEHVENVASFLESCLRCLKPGGRLIISVPNADSYLAFNVNAVLNMPPHHLTRWSEQVFRFVGDKYGLDIEAIEKELLADKHLDAYASILVREALAQVLGRRRRPLELNRSVGFRVMNWLIGRCGHLLSAGLVDRRMRPIGHTLTVVFKKRKESEDGKCE
jgi:SAM-dependent methyltransferase